MLTATRDKAENVFRRTNGRFSIMANVVNRAKNEQGRCLTKYLGLKFAGCTPFLPA